MGTSSRYGGPSPSSALIPSFLGDPAGPATGGGTNEGVAGPQQSLPPIPGAGSKGRFRTARSAFNTFASSGNRSDLRRSVSSYVRKGTGGSKGATRRMGAAIPAAGRLVEFVRDVSQAGVAQALANVGLGNLVGRSAEEALAALTDVFCAAGGPIDQSIARDAWDEAVLMLADAGITDITQVTAEQWQSLVADFISKTIESRVINDVGAKGIELPANIQAIDKLQSDLHEVIRGAVDDAIGDRLAVGGTLSQSEVQSLVEDIYHRSFTYLEALDEGEE